MENSRMGTPGTYLLVLDCREHGRVAVGRRLVLSLEPGTYLYTGSAFGSGGLQARISHHLQDAARPHWHIDHLRRYCSIAAVWYANGERELEHRWARALASAPGLSIPLLGFGSSDCRCLSHLFHSPLPPPDLEVPSLLGYPELHRDPLL